MTVVVPLTACAPLQLPEAVQAVTLMPDQVRLVELARYAASLDLQFNSAVAPAALQQRIRSDSYPDHVQGRRGQGTIPPAIHDEPDGPEDVHEVIGQGARFEPARR
jgi:hypothetical protein